MGARLSSVTAVRVGTVLVLIGIGLALATAALRADAALIIAAWIVAGLGMGLMSPRTSALTLAMSTPETQGFNSSAMTVADPFTAVFTLAAVIGLAAVVLAPRLAPKGGAAVEVEESVAG